MRLCERPQACGCLTAAEGRAQGGSFPAAFSTSVEMLPHQPSAALHSRLRKKRNSTMHSEPSRSTSYPMPTLPFRVSSCRQFDQASPPKHCVCPRRQSAVIEQQERKEKSAHTQANRLVFLLRYTISIYIVNADPDARDPAPSIFPFCLTQRAPLCVQFPH